MTNVKFDVSKLITDGAKIVKEARRIAGVFGNQREALHHVLCSAVNHAVTHNDCTVLNQVYDAFDNILNKKNGVQIWLQRKVIIGETEVSVTNMIRRMNKAKVTQWLAPKGEAVAANLEVLFNEPFYSLVEVTEKNNEPYSFAKIVARLLSSGRKRYEAKTGKKMPDAEKEIFLTLENVFGKWERDNAKAAETAAEALPVAA